MRSHFRIGGAGPARELLSSHEYLKPKPCYSNIDLELWWYLIMTVFSIKLALDITSLVDRSLAATIKMSIQNLQILEFVGTL